MSENHKRRTGEESVGIEKRHLVEGVELSKVCEEAGIHPTQFYRWQRVLFESGAGLFKGKAGRRGKEEEAAKEKRGELEQKLRRKDEVLAELREEHVRLKKSLGES